MVKLFDFNGHTPLVESEVTILKYTVLSFYSKLGMEISRLIVL
jgi:hypothetical protein